MKNIFLILAFLISFVGNAQITYNTFHFDIAFAHTDESMPYIEARDTINNSFALNGWENNTAVFSQYVTEKDIDAIWRYRKGHQIPLRVKIVRNAVTGNYTDFTYDLVKIIRKSENIYFLTYLRNGYSKEQCWEKIMSLKEFGKEGKYVALEYTGCSCPVGVLEYIDDYNK
jgi:hypothetical protein